MLGSNHSSLTQFDLSSLPWISTAISLGFNHQRGEPISLVTIPYLVGEQVVPLQSSSHKVSLRMMG